MIKKRYEALIGEWRSEFVDGIGSARALVDFVATTEIFDFATVMGTSGTSTIHSSH